MRKKAIVAIVLSGMIMMLGCTKAVEVVTSETESDSVSESETDIEPSESESESDSSVSSNAPYNYVPVMCADDALANIYAEGTDNNTYASAKEYVATMKANGMGATLADTIAVFNRCGFEYFGSNDLSDCPDDIYSYRVLVTADGDKLYYFLRNYDSSDFDWDDPTSSNPGYVLWGINDERNYDLLKDSRDVAGTYCGGYYFVGCKFPLSEEDDFDWWLSFLDTSELRLIRNSVYASHGRKFTSPDLAAIYGAQSWYRGTVEPDEFDKHVTEYLSKEEQDFVNKIAQREKELKSYVEKVDYDYAVMLVNGSYLDVNGDGKKERIFWGWSSHNTDSGKDILFVRGRLTVSVQWDETNEIIIDEQSEEINDAVYYVKSSFADLCLMTSADGPSDDPITSIYSFKGKDIINHGYVEVYPGEIKWYKDHIIAGYRGGILNTEEIRTEYVLNADSQFVINPNIDYFEYRGNTVKAKENLRTFDTKDGAIGADIKAGEEFIILGGDEDVWIKVERVKGGKQCWIKLEEGGVVLADGSTLWSDKAIEGLVFYD